MTADTTSGTVKIAATGGIAAPESLVRKPMTAMTMTESRPRRISGASSSRRRSGSVPKMPGRSTIMTTRP